MALIIAIELIFLSLAVLQQETVAAPQVGLLLLSCLGNESSNSSGGPLLRRGQTPLRRDDYSYTPGIGAYKVHLKAANWNTCRKICLEEGGHLAVINSVAEAQHIAHLAKSAGSQTGSEWQEYFHVGCHNLYNQEEWVTIHGESLIAAGFNEWDAGQPDVDGGACGCINYSTVALDDSTCKTPLGFICELPYV